MVTGAWTNVRHDTVAHCFRRARFVITAEQGTNEVPGDDGSKSPDDALRQLCFPGRYAGRSRRPGLRQ